MKRASGPRIGGLVALLAVCFTTSVPALADDDLVRVEIVRPERKGEINRVPAIVTVSGAVKRGRCEDVIRGAATKNLNGGEATVLLGGDRVICQVPRGQPIEVFTPRALRPEKLSPDAASWAATELQPRPRGGQLVRLTVSPKSRGNIYLGGWIFRQVGQP